MERARTVAVIGAGFSGVMTAVHLLRESKPLGLRVVLVNRTGMMARGVAYGTRSSAHLLNVPAGRMSAFHDDPNHFLQYAQQRDSAVTATTFLPRSHYGEYLEEILKEAERDNPGRLDRVVGEVASIEPHSSRLRLTTTNGGAFSADRVALALGNYPPRNPEIPNSVAFDSSRYVRDPWAPNALGGADLSRPILLIGTGLTMVDVALDLHSRGAAGPVVAFSRRGLLPQSHRPGIAAGLEHRPPEIAAGPATTRAYFRSIRFWIEEWSKQGIGWRTVIDSMRPLTAELWQRLPLDERTRFLRHVRAYWEVLRHRVAEAPFAALQQRIASGWLDVRAARLVDLRESNDGMFAYIRRRGQLDLERLQVGTAINCTGPSGDIRVSADPLMSFLRDSGDIVPDQLGLGIAVDADGTVLNRSGTRSPWLFYIGPLARAVFWERTAVPELRVMAHATARTLVERLEEKRAAA